MNLKFGFLANRAAIFLFDLIVLSALFGLAIAYFKAGLDDLIPEELRRQPSYAVWFGALGGVVVSFKNVLDTGTPWDPKWAIWYYGKPFLSAVIGGMTFVLLRVVSSGEPKTEVLEAAAFIVGIQEKMFFDLLSKVAEIVFTVPATKESLQVTGVQPEAAAAGAPLTISGQGFLQGSTVKLGSLSLEDIQVSADGKSLTGKVPSGGSGPVDVLVKNPDGSAYVKQNGFRF